MSPDDLARILDDLTARFGPAAVRLWELAVKQSIIEGIASIVAGLLLVLGPALGYAYVVRRYRAHKKASRNEYRFDEDDVMPFVFLFFLVLCPVVLGFISLRSGVIWALNPEWQAISILGRLLPS